MAPLPDSTLANILAAASGIAWVLFILNWALGPGVWWFVFVPILLSSLAGKQRQELHRREALWQKQQNPQLPPGSSDRPVRLMPRQRISRTVRFGRLLT